MKNITTTLKKNTLFIIAGVVLGIIIGLTANNPFSNAENSEAEQPEAVYLDDLVAGGTYCWVSSGDHGFYVNGYMREYTVYSATPIPLEEYDEFYGNEEAFGDLGNALIVLADDGYHGDDDDYVFASDIGLAPYETGDRKGTWSDDTRSFNGACPNKREIGRMLIAVDGLLKSSASG